MATDVKREILRPRIGGSVFIAPGACIYGDVEIEKGSSIWFNAVIRGDEGKITIGKSTNIQDNVVIHSDMMVGVEIANNVTIGHGAIIRGCKIGSNVMVGMNTTVMTNAEIGDDCIIGANSLVSYNKKFPPRSLILGVPAKRVRPLEDKDMEGSRIATEIYRQLVEKYSGGRISGYRK